MRRGIQPARHAVGVGALCLCIYAVLGLGGGTRLPDAVLASSSGPGTDATPRSAVPGSWSVRIDGWTIEVDRAAARVAPAVVESADMAEAVVAPADEPDEEAEEAAPALSAYDGLIGKHAQAAGLDWRLVSAIIYEESRFQPGTVSPAGAYGLMQVRPIAARDVGEEHFREPDANIRTGVRYLQRLDRMFAAARGRDRLALVLAAYNMGPGHVQDAQALARHWGYDPLAWNESMVAMLPLLEEPQVYGYLPNGYAQGNQTVAYVERVLRRFDAYRRALAVLPPGAVPGASAID